MIPDTPYSIEVKDLDIGYKSPSLKLLLENINFGLKPGNLISVIGGNGVGKTTLLRTLAKLQNPLSGEVYIQNKLLKAITNTDLAKDISLVLTNPPASKSLSVYEFIALGRYPHTNWMGKLSDVDLQKITKAIEVTEVQDLLEYKCYQLSDGQYQRIAIARTIAQDTPIIILDEPTTHLDLYHRAYVLKLLQNLAKKHNKTILFSTHEIELALQLSDQVLLLQPKQIKLDTPNGIIESGLLDSLFPKDTIYFDTATKQFKAR